MKKCLLLCIVILPTSFFAQKEGDIWIFGTGISEPDSAYKLNYITFSDEIIDIELLYQSIPFYGSQSIVSDSSGRFYYTNGINIYNNTHEIVENGMGFQSSTQYPYGFPFNQSALLLPLPSSPIIDIMIDASHVDIGSTIIVNTLRYSLIDGSLNNGKGEVISKKIELTDIADSLNTGHLTAVRHANGRDWWILTSRYKTNTYIKYLLSPVGITNMSEQNIGEVTNNGVGYSVFSPDGEWYARFTAYGATNNPKASLHFYRFDRCTGILSDPNYKFYPGPDVYGGVAFSPNSRYMYVSKYTKILQYDLEAPDILASEQTVAEYDGFLDENGVPTRFYGLQLAPDGKIYGNIPNFNSRYIHVIDQPDLPGDSCNVIQHAIYLPAHNFGTLPNLPWYRLYEAEGSPCDTLGVSSQWSPPPAVPAIRVWPIPAADVLHFSAEGDWPEPLDLVLYDALGKAVLSYASLRVSPFAQIDLTVLPPGAYFYTLIRPNGTMVKSGKVVRTR
jgi:hypothetical protein